MLHEAYEAGTVAEWGASGRLAWDPDPGSELGPALAASDGDATAGGHGSGRVEARFGYLPLGGGVVAPWAGVDLAEGERGYRLGWASTLAICRPTTLRIELVAARREPAGATPEHALSIEATLRW